MRRSESPEQVEDLQEAASYRRKEKQERESRVLQMHQKGEDNRTIAERLGVSWRFVWGVVRKWKARKSLRGIVE